MTLWGRNREKVVVVSQVRKPDRASPAGDRGQRNVVLPGEELKFPRLAPLVSNVPKSY